MNIKYLLWFKKNGYGKLWKIVDCSEKKEEEGKKASSMLSRAGLVEG